MHDFEILRVTNEKERFVTLGKIADKTFPGFLELTYGITGIPSELDE